MTHDRERTTTEQPYLLTVREDGRLVSRTPMADPFHNTTIHLRGWRNALRLLLRRLEVTVHVDADSDFAEKVMDLNPNYIGPPGSKSRLRWNKELDAALHEFAEGLPDD